AEHELEQRRLAGAVLAEHADDVAGLDAERHVLEHSLAVERFTEPVCGGVWNAHPFSPKCCVVLSRRRSLRARAAAPPARPAPTAARAAARASRAATACGQALRSSSACRGCVRARLPPRASSRPSTPSSD